MVARLEVLSRAETIWKPGTVPYSQVTTHKPDGYRCDCSGYVSMCWGISPPGKSTVTLVTEQYMTEISITDLLPGDAIGLCGPGTAGNAGHIQLFDHWTDGGLVIWEQAGGTTGPTRRTIKRITPGYRAYRFVGISSGEDDVLRLDEDQFSDLVTLVLKGVSVYGYAANYPNQQIKTQVPGNDLSSVAAKLSTQIANISTGDIDTDKLANDVAAKLATNPTFLAAVAKSVNDDAANRLKA